MTRKTNQPNPAASRNRTAARAALAASLAEMRAVLNDVERIARAIHREATGNPDGEFARALGRHVVSLHDIAVDLSTVDASLSDVFLTPEEPLPDPVAAVRGL